MKISCHELTGPALDYAVAVASNKQVTVGTSGISPSEGPVVRDRAGWVWSPTSSWANGGVFIEMMKIHLKEDNGWTASIRNEKISTPVSAEGRTALLAAMRVYVLFVLGSEIEIPEILCYSKQVN